VVNGRDCQVFSASNVELVTKTRTEHLSPEDKSKVAGSGFLLNSLLAVGQHLEESTSLPVGFNNFNCILKPTFFNVLCIHCNVGWN
jgi:septin 4